MNTFDLNNLRLDLRATHDLYVKFAWGDDSPLVLSEWPSGS